MALLDRAALDPDLWENACDRISRIVDGSGAVLVPEDIYDRPRTLPHSTSLAEPLERFFGEGWHSRDPRRNGFVNLITTGHVTDQDLVTADEMKREPYYREWLEPAGLRWFVGIGFRAGTQRWSAAVHGSITRGAFNSSDIEKLVQLRVHLSLAAKRAIAMGNQRFETLEAAFSAVSRGVAVLGWSGRIVWQNEHAEHLLRVGELAVAGRLRSTDAFLQAKLDDLVSSAVSFQTRPGLVLPGPVLAPAGSGRNISIDAIPMPSNFSALASDAVALLTLHEVAANKPVTLDDFASRFHLTRREMEIATHLLSGGNLSRSAERMKISVPTARQYVKSVFAKTGTHGQAELVALLARNMNK